MKTIYHLSTCKTCQKVIAELGADKFDRLIDIKNNPLPASVLDAAAAQLGGYEMVFNKRAIKFRTQGIKDQIKKDQDYRPHLLAEYTFMKRPLFDLGGVYLAGYSKKVLEEVQKHL